MHPNAEMIQKFYESFARLEADGMVGCYHPDATFTDPVFETLPAWKAKAMWRMLCERAQDFSLTFRDVQADDRTGSAYWEPTYTFSKTGNVIVNKINAGFEFQDGKIIKHVDRFSLYRWARLALGFKGVLLGWLPSVQKQIRKEAQAG
ncbi:MAG: nuclear transport factor 2 family protein, partial [Leptospiraceae bacterium]|nr:nuclear transport factor 2 family protein [Leptospiraceae bacterium]